MKKLLKDNLIFIFIVILAIIPIILWFFMSSLVFRFSSRLNTFRSLGQLTGLLGMVLLSINFILAARFKFLDKIFDGLNKVYIKHHLIGAISFCLLLFHPTFLILQYLSISLKSSFNFLFPFHNLAIILGEVTLLFFIVLMIITFYLNFKYQNWKNTHKYLGIVLFFGSWHMLLIPSDISSNLLLKYYMLCLVIFGAFSYFYRTIFKIYKKEEFKYKLEKIIRVNNDVVELELSPLANKIKFIPGQFVFLRFENDGILSESHPFSITSSANSHNLSLGIKVLGDYTLIVSSLKPKVICFIEGPFGVFSYKNAYSHRQIWIAGGIGITPFLSMARQINTEKAEFNFYNIDLYYSVKNSSELAFVLEFEQIARQNSNFKFHPHLSERDGYISASLVSKNENINTEIFLCGPKAFMQSLREQFIKLGFNNNRVHSEEFSL